MELSGKINFSGIEEVWNSYVEVDDRQGIQMSVLGKVDPAENPYHGDAILSHRNGVAEEVWGLG